LEARCAVIDARAAAALAAAATVVMTSGAASAQSCGADLVFPRLLESGRYAVAYVTRPAPVVAGEHFVVDFAVCPRNGAPAPEAVRVDASMPEHRHGMNYRPVVVPKGDGRYKAEGLMFHMSGRWELSFDLVTPAGTDRLAGPLHIE
jgi:YtkA-like